MGLNNDHRAAADLYGASSKFSGAKPYTLPSPIKDTPEECANALAKGHEQVQYEDHPNRDLGNTSSTTP